MIRVVIIEDQELFRLGIKTALAQEPEMEVCGEASSGKSGIELVEATNPDIVLVDIGLPDINGLVVTKYLKKRTKCKVIILTCYSAHDVIHSALECGADSYILKKNDLELIKRAIKNTYDDHEYIDPVIIKRFLASERKKVKGKTYNDLPTLTEIEILKLIALGHSNKEIASKLFVSVHTVKSHVLRLFRKLDATNRVEAIIKARDFGYLESEF